MKKFILPAILLATLSLVSCGSGGTESTNDSTNNDSTPKEAPKATFEESCKDASQIAITVKGYKYEMSGSYTFETANFEVKQSSIAWSTDSNATLTLKNYAAADLVGDRKDDQVDIIVELRSRHGKKIEAATYNHSDSEADFSSFTTMQTSKGVVYFNWVAGMPEQGFVKLNFIDGDQACGSFSLAVEKTDSEQIGTVRINGSFKTAK